MNIQSENKLLKEYFTKEINLKYIINSGSYYQINEKDLFVKWFINFLLNQKISRIINILKECNIQKIQPSNIPQFSNIDNAIHRLPEIIYNSKKNILTFDEIGYYLNFEKKFNCTKKVWGESFKVNYFIKLLNLKLINLNKNLFFVCLLDLGKEYIFLNKIYREKLISILILRIPIIQSILIDAFSFIVRVSYYMQSLSQTLIRRRPNIIYLINFIKRYSDNDLDKIFTKIGV